MVAVLLPESRRVVIEKLEPAHPFGTLPEVEPGYDQTARAAVLHRQRDPVMPVGEESIVAHQVSQQEVRGVIRICVDHHRGCFGEGPRPAKYLGHSHSLPSVVEPAPAGDAVHVGGYLNPGKLEELLPGPCHRLLNQAKTAEGPTGEIERRRLAIGQHRPFPGEHLPAGQAIPGSRFVHLELRFGTANLVDNLSAWWRIKDPCSQGAISRGVVCSAELPSRLPISRLPTCRPRH